MYAIRRTAGRVLIGDLSTALQVGSAWPRILTRPDEGIRARADAGALSGTPSKGGWLRRGGNPSGPRH